MNYDHLRKYNILKKEDIIWFIYFFIVAAQIYSNYMEEENIKYNTYDKKTIRNFNLVVLIIVFFIYIYFFKKSYDEVKYLCAQNKPYKTKLAKMGMFANMLFIISGLIFIYVEYNSIDDDEIGIV